jgi:hypothetical protein
MSHNQITVNNQSANLSSAITLNLDDIITINSPTTGQLLKKDSTDWKTGLLPAGAAGLINNLATSSSGNTTYTYDYQDCYISRKQGGEYSVFNDVTWQNSSGSYVPVATGAWAMAFFFSSANFPSGSKVLLRAVVGPYRFSGSNLTVQFFAGSATQGLSNSVAIGQKAYSTVDFGATAFGLYESVGTSTYITIRVVDVTGNIAISSGLVASIQQITAKQLV